MTPNSLCLCFLYAGGSRAVPRREGQLPAAALQIYGG